METFFLYSSAHWKLGGPRFKSSIVSTLFSFVVAFALANRHFRTRQSLVCKIARKLLKGMATHNDNTGTTTITNIDTLRLIGLSETHIGVAIHRIKWFAEICKKEENHHNIFLSNMFSNLVEINEPAGVMLPHLRQLSNDLHLFRHVEKLAEYVDNIVNDP